MTNRTKAGFSQKLISPEKGVSLCGYFNNRFNEGIHDDLYVRAMALTDGDTAGMLLVVDNVGVFAEIVGRIRKRIASRLDIPEQNIFVQATHTHTAPILRNKTQIAFSPDYLELFIKQSVAAAVEAYSVLEPVTFAVAVGKERSVSFCRRFIIRDGAVATNPPKDSSDILQPESEIDYTLAVVAVRNLSGKIIGVLAHCANHVDCIGGNMVSADWPGVLCARLATDLASHPQVILLNGMAGNINHYDITNPEQENGFDEAERVGCVYAEAALKLLHSELAPLELAGIGFDRVLVDLPRLKLTEKQLAQAKTLLAECPLPDELPTLHSVDIATGNRIVASFLADKQLKFAAEDVISETIEVAGLWISDLALIGLPMEPFSEIGTDIRKRSPFKYTFPLGIVNGAKGYLGTKEAIERPGGMETLPGSIRRFVPEAADLLTDAAEQIAKSMADKAATRPQ